MTAATSVIATSAIAASLLSSCSIAGHRGPVTSEPGATSTAPAGPKGPSSTAPSTSIPPSTLTSPGLPGSWRLVFDDEFNGTTLDPTKWNANWLGSPGAATPPVNPYELANYSPAQVSVSGGCLQLTAEAGPSTVDGTTRPYISGLVNTHGLFDYTYGYAEARIEVTATSETIFNWPSFWTVGPGPWPQTGEDDIFEGLEGSATWHFRSATGSTDTRVAGDFSGWHTYGADWEPGSVTYYYDGKEVGSTTEHITDVPMYIILNLAIGGPPSGPVKVPATMKVDYVRVWQH